MEELTIVSWNIHGLGHPNRVKAVQRWLGREAKRAKIIALQELKASQDVLDFNIRMVRPNSHTIVDYSASDRRGAALIIDRSLSLVDQGIRGDGTVAWARVNTPEGVIGFVSVYGPDSALEKIRLYDWLQAFDISGKWVLMGDWNMTLDPLDSVGPTPMLHGSPLRRWRALDQSGDLLDCYDAAGRRIGPRFTRQAVRGARLDQSRLDRAYISNMGNWIYAVTQIKHCDKIAVSDHIPVLVDLSFHPPRRRSSLKRSPYTKMDAEELKDLEFRSEVQKVWEEGYSLSDDPITAWSLAWGKVQRLYENPRAVSLTEFQELEKKVREEDLVDGKRRRPNSLLLCDKFVSTDQNHQLSIRPEEEEVEAIVMLMKKDKSPGSDGLTAEVLRASWTWTKNAYNALIREIWKGRRLGKNDVMGIVKLLPKSEERQFLRNWRPITLMSMTYKIVSKLLAERLKRILPSLIDSEQTGFIEKRSIVDNILCLKLGQELAEHSKQESLFCKLDFVKAFDKVQH
ncbi:hypothetical protein R1sor_022755 [Riccia sorocarpa]|uniref:Reverse transcriptase domain-containing protein n=1 Tax=Riccia sorocarpa TaxID=122646 RepID=A0ABD3GMY2_9MARC